MADGNGIRRTVVPTPENRKVGGSTLLEFFHSTPESNPSKYSRPAPRIHLRKTPRDHRVSFKIYHTRS
jgi:hypothetical protein